MSNHTILIIDDSATIRRFVDNELSSVGYRVITAANAEDGIATAAAQKPNLIILDHQLPGTTGYEVCCELLKDPELASIPVVASSTLRKKAYAEYVDCDNVVDMLPKPYRPEALIATVSNAIDTAEMVVQSQSQGSAVPEVIEEMGESDLSGKFGCFGIRELLDLLNNGEKAGMLEVETDQCRVFIYVDRGRIQAVTASGLGPQTFADQLPDSLSELAPVLKFTLSGRRGSEVDGLVDLLNTKVLDPRLLKKLLRFQAAMLLRICFQGSLKNFRFDQSQRASSLFQKLPLDCSLLALLVEGALSCEADELPKVDSSVGYARRAIRGQNLDRAGLSSRHLKLMGALSNPISLQDLASQLGWELTEVRRVLHGFELADLVEQKAVAASTRVAVVSSSPSLNERLATFFSSNAQAFKGKLVREWNDAPVLIQRLQPQVLLVHIEDVATLQQLDELRSTSGILDGVRVGGVYANEGDLGLIEQAERVMDFLLEVGFTDDTFVSKMLDREAAIHAPGSNLAEPGSAVLPVAPVEA